MNVLLRNFSNELHRALKVKAAERGQTLTSLIIEILEKWLKEEK